MKGATRPYRMTARAVSTARTATAILQAAWELFADRPFAEITLADIADRSGVRTQTVLRRFGDKDAVFAAMFAAFFQINSFASELRTAGLRESPAATWMRFDDVRRGLRGLPPETWTSRPAQGTMAVARYLAECTAPEDRVLVATYADEVPYFARRRFAAGQGAFYSNYLKSASSQRLALQRLAHQSVPVVISHPDYHEEFVANYPEVAHYIAGRYREVGVVDYDGRPVLRVLVETARQPLRTDPVLGFPCFR